MLMDGAMRHILKIPNERRITGNVQDTRSRRTLRFDRRVGRVDHLHAIDGKGVLIDTRLDRSDRCTPFAILAFL
jgi:hypothetical protein